MKALGVEPCQPKFSAEPLVGAAGVVCRNETDLQPFGSAVRAHLIAVEDSGSAIQVGEPQTIATIAHDRNRPSPRKGCNAAIGCPYRILEIEYARTNEGNPKSSGLVDGQSLRVAVGARGGYRLEAPLPLAQQDVPTAEPHGAVIGAQ